MSQNHPPLVGSVFERKQATHSAPKAFSPAKSGFPVAQHRSKSAFARNIEGLRKTGTSRPRDVPVVSSGRSVQPLEPTDSDEWRNQMSRENEQRVASMTGEEREEERQEILDRFGAGVGDLLKRVRLAREKQGQEKRRQIDNSLSAEPADSAFEPIPVTAREGINREIGPSRLSPPPPALSTSSTRPSSRTDRKLRFAELGPEDVHVYESAPPSPRRKALALPPPSNDQPAVSLGKFSGRLAPPSALVEPPVTQVDEPEEGSAEYIRRRYFPNTPANDPNLAWMQQSSETDLQSTSLRFDLAGKPIPPSISSTLPTHLGLHHHAEGSHAGYTLDDMFLLSRSTVPAQRATMLGVLAKVARRIAAVHDGETEGMEELVGKEEELRKRIVAAGAEAMSEKGSVGARAVEVIWQCVVGWDEKIASFEEVEVESPSDAGIASLRLDFFLPQVVTLLAQGDLLEETKLQLLGILHRLAQQTNALATSIVTTLQLVPTIIQTFLLTPIPPTETSTLPNPDALRLLTTLANASRSNASALREPADALLRFITFLPSSSLFSLNLATSLLTETLHLYTALARYGLYSHIATTAMEQFTQLSRYILSDGCSSSSLVVAWLDLLAAWMVCAVDPHQTTPDHDILWSQIIGWGWNSEIDAISDLLGVEMTDWPTWAGVWKLHAVWLEGSKVNGVRGGSSERMECLNVIKSGFEDGKERQVVTACLETIRQLMDQLTLPPVDQAPTLLLLRTIAGHATTLSAAIRMWLSCLPPISDGPLESPPFPLPFSQLSDLCAMITIHPLWSLLNSTERSIRSACVHLRPLSELLSYYLRLSRRLPTTSKDMWAAQAFSVLTRLLPGDEAFASQVVDDIFDLISPEWMRVLGIQVPPVVWDRHGMLAIRPFVAHTIQSSDISIGPTSPTPQSILNASTQRLPTSATLRTFGLPLSREWTLSALDHLLRSGSSEVFKALPAGWDASEIDITRASLLLTRVCRETMHHFSLVDFALTREDAVFGCMKVFMLEHGQAQATDSTEEVFRDQVVGQFMTDLLRPYTFSTASAQLPSPPSQGDLEQVSKKFLDTTPFYQYYTDFVALYDSISFSQPLFASLLLPPTSMKYALDYRKHLWNDFSHVLKTIRTPTDQVICGDLKDYLYPLEEDPQMLSFYLRALLKQQLQGFVRLVALHHVSSSIWPDLNVDSEWSNERASKLLNVVVGQGGHDLVREVVQYQQDAQGPTLIPPQCFKTLDARVKDARLESITRWGLLDKVQTLSLTI